MVMEITNVAKTYRQAGHGILGISRWIFMIGNEKREGATTNSLCPECRAKLKLMRARKLTKLKRR
jgi:hypothetical protein